jgi:serine/threonine protein kinase
MKDSAKLCDFGCATMFSDEDPNRRSYCGTLDYLAPEMVLISKTQEAFDRGYTCKIDNWALGILAYELITGMIPF